MHGSQSDRRSYRLMMFQNMIHVCVSILFHLELKNPYHETFFNVLNLRKLLWVVCDHSDSIWVKLDHLKKIRIFIFSVCLCVKFHSRALVEQLEESFTFSRMDMSEFLWWVVSISK